METLMHKFPRTMALSLMPSIDFLWTLPESKSYERLVLLTLDWTAKSGAESPIFA